MAEASVSRSAPRRWSIDAGLALQIATLVGVLACWEAAGASGLLYKGVVPSSVRILAALGELLASSRFWFNLSVTAMEVGKSILRTGPRALCQFSGLHA